MAPSSSSTHSCVICTSIRWVKVSGLPASAFLGRTLGEVLPPAVLRPGGSVEVLSLPAGPPIGTGVGGYRSLTVRMDCGAKLLLQTTSRSSPPAGAPGVSDPHHSSFD